jgi:hypothetical protein
MVTHGECDQKKSGTTCSAHSRSMVKAQTATAAAAESEEKLTWGSGGLYGNRALGSLVLMVLTPLVILTFWYTCKIHKGSFMSLGNEIMTEGFMQFLSNVWPTAFDAYSWKMIGSYMAFELFLMRCVPGKEFRASVTPTGHVPVYIANGIQCYLREKKTDDIFLW